MWTRRTCTSRRTPINLKACSSSKDTTRICPGWWGKFYGETNDTGESPKAVRIPPGLSHNYRFIKGSGEYWNIVLTPGAEHNKTIR